MTELELNAFPRREFLRGALGVAGVVALGLETAQAAPAPEATASVPASAPALAAAYWNGTRLVDARHLASGDPECHSGVRLAVAAHPTGAALRGINAHYAVTLHGTETHTPYHAWTRNALGNVGTRFTLPVAPNAGILLSAQHGSDETFVRLRTDAASGQAKLRTGLYVLAVGAPDWNVCHLDLDAPSGPLLRRTLSGFVPVRFGYRLVTVEQA